MFDQKIVLVPIPVSPQVAIRHARELDRQVAKDGMAEVKQRALNDILTADNRTDPSETERLRALYRHAYTPEELVGLIDRTFSQFGIREPD